MSAKTLRLFVVAPIYLVGLGTCLLGLAWLFAPEPWLLDQSANEVLLQTTFQQLLAADSNRHLSDYLTGLYRFFGWWIFAIGLLIVIYTLATRLGTMRERNYFYLAMAVIVAGLYALQLRFIPSSPFLWTSHGFALMIITSAVAARRLDAAA